MIEYYLDNPDRIPELSRSLRYHIYRMKISPDLIARKIANKYVRLPVDQQELRRMFSALMGQMVDFYQPHKRERLMKKLEISGDGIHSISELLGAKVLGYTGSETLTLSESLERGPVVYRYTKLPNISHLGAPEDLEKVIILNKTFREEPGFLIAWRDIDHSIVLAVLCDRKGDIFVTEEFVDNQPPVYVTPEGIFISPVYYVMQAKKVFERLLEMTGYPLLNVKTRVLFTDIEANLLNRNEFLEYGEAHYGEWDWVEVCERRLLRSRSFIGPTLPLTGSGEDDTSGLDRTLRLSLIATSHIVDSLHYDPQVLDADSRNIDDRCDRLEIFTRNLNPFDDDED